ncbi:hypothetical protein, partial [Pararhodobacter sp.]|uniref:hypothetical protein n=1 Tax=Pararhodobacter sp. TaxID=2127056 RepID=UPI002FDE7E33
VELQAVKLSRQWGPATAYDEPHIGLVVAAFDFQRRDLDLLHQLALIGIDRIRGDPGGIAGGRRVESLP